MSIKIAFDKIPPDVVELCQQLVAAGYEAFLVGGGVRDLLLNREVHDWDVATSALPPQVQEVFPRTLPIGIQHGTVVVLLRSRQVEVTTYRGEGEYSDGRHPDEVVFIQSLREDLERRDLTINAMAIDPIQRALIDPMGGEQDLGQRIIRAVGTPAVRLAEDALRTMRAIRFAAVLEFSVHPDTLSAIVGARSALANVSWERIRDELLKILAARKPSVGIHLMRDTGLMQHVLPELLEGIGVRQNKYHLEDPYEHAVAVCDATEGDPILRLTALLHDIGKPRTAAPHATKAGEQTFYRHEKIGAEMAASITKRLKLSSTEQGRICHLIARHNFFFSGWSASGLRRFIRKVGIEHLPSLYALRRADLLGRKRSADTPDQLEQLEQMWERINKQLEDKAPLGIGDLAINGREVMEQLQISSGPRVGQILRALLEKVLDDPSLNERAQLQALVRKLHRDLDPS